MTSGYEDGIFKPLYSLQMPNLQGSNNAKNAGKASDIKEITVVASEGKIERVIRDIVAPKFQEKYGVKINIIAGLSGEILSRVELQKNAPQIDVAFYAPLMYIAAKNQGLAKDIDPSIVTNLNEVDDSFFALDKTASVPVFGHVNAPAYNTKVLNKITFLRLLPGTILSGRSIKVNTAFADITSDLG